MRRILRFFGIVEFVVIAAYLLRPSPDFPPPPPGSYVSVEPADTETIYRQAYFTNLSRSEIMHYYQDKFRAKLQLGLNHPPEDAGQLIREQTRSNYLEELVHPLKESLYISGYVPTKPEDTIVREGQIYNSKITVRYVPTSPVTRMTVLLMTAIVTYLLVKEYRHA